MFIVIELYTEIFSISLFYLADYVLTYYNTDYSTKSGKVQDFQLVVQYVAERSQTDVVSISKNKTP